MTTATPTLIHAMPALGAPWLGQGGLFAGLRRGADGGTEVLILAAATPAGPLKWKSAVAWAKSVEADGHADFQLPDRDDVRLLWVNAREHFEKDWYWSDTQSSADHAWCQNFINGTQHRSDKGNTLLARAVRRFILQSFNPSTPEAHEATAAVPA
jgi:hypothetical protein